MTCKKDTTCKHAYLEVSNLEVMKLMTSLKSRNLVTEQFCWQYYYYALNDQGIEYLRQYLHVDANTVPATLKKSSKPQQAPSIQTRGRVEGADGEIEIRRGGMRGGMRGGRGGYRGAEGREPREGREGGDERRGGRGGRGRGGFRSEREAKPVSTPAQ